MIKIDPRATTIKKSTCPFCSYGCELGIVLDDFGVKGVEYLTDALNNQGRLCPRGSAAAYYLNHPGRLTVPQKNHRAADWDTIRTDLKKDLKKPERMAITFDRNLTQEEHAAIMGLCSQTGIRAAASSYLEPESLLYGFVGRDQTFNWAELESASAIAVIGDLFQFAPMTSKHIIEWRYRDRKNRLTVVDSLGSYTGKFATDFLKIGIGHEPLVMLGLADELDDKVDPGVPRDRLRAIGEALKAAASGIIFVCLPYGRTYDPLLFVQALKILRDQTGKKVVPFVEYFAMPGTMGFGEVIELVRAKQIKQIVNFGDNFPFLYPQVVRLLKGAEFIATATLKHRGFENIPFNRNGTRSLIPKFTMLPAALNLEKAGTLMTTFGPRPLKPEISAASGVRNINQILALFGEITASSRPMPPADLPVAVPERIEKLKERIRTRKKGKYLLAGDKVAFNFMNFWTEERVRINPIDARQIAVKRGGSIVLRSKNGEEEFAVELSEANPTGVLTVPAESARSRILFDCEVDQGFINFPPTEVGIWRKE
jgi:hypothetical protein